MVARLFFIVTFSIIIGMKDLKRRKVNIQSWCQVDMEADGEQEVVLQTDSGNELVLTYKDGKVYSYAFPFRGMKNIKTDGTFESYKGDIKRSKQKNKIILRMKR
ncbi:putative uncharacterized protein [Eubacterium sp. CAG:192]|jgi:hypothetical protein|uniref:hypothetical protein n=1 Tax=Eubacterium sp. Marseille-QA0814 TaxID=3378778 RepID=UPI0003379197|nr:hypothetical protein [uncultured Eubacterium sp.]CDB14005.1 putative uncharacterized protein [Eubacterium sp. CAG:192]